MPEETTVRLRTMIERGEEYFILTGSDPEQLKGCCPSDDVGATNLLVEAGILQLWTQPLHENACPSNIYAFASEVTEVDGKPKFTPNDALRQDVLAFINSGSVRKQTPLQATVRRGLLLFVATAAAYFVLMEIQASRNGTSMQSNTMERLASSLTHGEGVLVCHFRAKESCKSCVSIKRLTKKALDDYFAEDMIAGRVVLHEIDNADPLNRAIKKDFGIATSSVVLVSFKGGKEHKRIMLENIWSLLKHDQLYLDLMRREISQMLSK